jgi:hypothetical protein
MQGCSVLALRRRRSYTWSTQELIDALVGGSAEPVEYWRTEFAALLVLLPRHESGGWLNSYAPSPCAGHESHALGSRPKLA